LLRLRERRRAKQGECHNNAEAANHSFASVSI
jgi:hypothetical protein